MEKIVHMPREIIYKILQYLPDIDSLTNAAVAHPAFYGVLMRYETSVATTVLRREIPHQHYIQALCHSAILEGNYCLPRLAGIAEYRPCLASFMQRVRHQCDRVQSLTVSLKSARLISRTDKMVADICQVLISDDSFTNWQALYPLRNVISFPRPSQEERIRVHHGIYLFNLLACLCKNLEVDEHDNAVGLDNLRQELQQSIIEHLMAPWEFYHTIGIRIYLYRALCRLVNKRGMKKAYIPSITVSGIDVLHRILCAMNFSRKDEAGRPDVITALDSRGLAFRSILSNALGKSWSQKWNEDSEAYRPLWKENGTDIDAWKKFESKQFETLGNSPRLSDVIKHDISLLDGSFGLWGAALWDGNRWEAIVELTAETSADAHLDPMALGILLVEEKAWARRNGF